MLGLGLSQCAWFRAVTVCWVLGCHSVLGFGLSQCAGFWAVTVCLVLGCHSVLGFGLSQCAYKTITLLPCAVNN